MWVSCYSMCMFDEIWHKWICCMGCNVMWHALCSMIIKYCYRMLPWSLWRTFWYACCPVQDTNPFSEQKLQIESFRQYIECFNRKWESNVDPHSPCVTPIRCREGVTWLVNLSIVFTHCIGQTKNILPVLCGRLRRTGLVQLVPLQAVGQHFCLPVHSESSEHIIAQIPYPRLFEGQESYVGLRHTTIEYKQINIDSERNC